MAKIFYGGHEESLERAIHKETLLNWTTLRLRPSIDQQTPVREWRGNPQSGKNIDKLIEQWANVWIGPSSERIPQWLVNK